MSVAERRAYEARLERLEAVAVRLGGQLVAAEDSAEAAKLSARLEATEIEIELLRERLLADDGEAAA